MRTAMSNALEMKRSADVSRLKCRGEVARAFKNEHVMTITGERIAFRQRVIHKDGQVECCAECQGGVERRILVRAHGGSRPVEHEFPRR